MKPSKIMAIALVLNGVAVPFNLSASYYARSVQLNRIHKATSTYTDDVKCLENGGNYLSLHLRSSAEVQLSKNVEAIEERQPALRDVRWVCVAPLSKKKTGLMTGAFYDSGTDSIVLNTNIFGKNAEVAASGTDNLPQVLLAHELRHKVQNEKKLYDLVPAVAEMTGGRKAGELMYMLMEADAVTAVAEAAYKTNNAKDHDVLAERHGYKEVWSEFRSGYESGGLKQARRRTFLQWFRTSPVAAYDKFYREMGNEGRRTKATEMQRQKLAAFMAENNITRKDMRYMSGIVDSINELKPMVPLHIASADHPALKAPNPV